MMELPPPLLLQARRVVTAKADPPAQVSVAPDAENDHARAYAFGNVLARSRASRGLLDGTLTIFSSAVATPDQPPRNHLWVPHVFCWQHPDEAALAWELSPQEAIEKRLGPVAAVKRWAKQAKQLLRLVEMAAAEQGTVDPGVDDDYLSFRWILAHENEVGEALTRSVVSIEHVSLHVDPSEEEVVVSVLIEALGLIEIQRPNSISVPGRWLQAGSSKVHLNSRQRREGEHGFPGTSPNHICFAVDDLDAAEAALENAGIATTRAGSLGHQVWFSLSETTIELQPLRNQGTQSGS